MVICSVVALTAKALSPSVRLTRAATAWIRTGRSQGAAAPAGRRALRLRLHRPPPPATPRVVAQFPSAPERISTSSHNQEGTPSYLVEMRAASSSPAARVELEKK